MSDVTFDMLKNSMEVHQRYVEPWRVTLVNTGEDTLTGGRLRRVREHLGDEPFCVTYGDGVADIDIRALIDFHKGHGKPATVTADGSAGRLRRAAAVGKPLHWRPDWWGYRQGRNHRARAHKVSASDEFQAEVQRNIGAAGKDQGLRERSLDWMLEAGGKYNYSYNLSWLGRPIIQYPQDIVAMQELVWAVQPDLIIETGIAHGGSLILFASLLELNAICGGPSDARLLGIDIDIRQHNREAIEAHPMFRRIDLIQGSSIAPEVVDQVRWAAQGKRVLVSQGSYCVVFDTVVEDTPDELRMGRPWRKGISPKSAVREYLNQHPEFAVNERIDSKLLISVAPGVISSESE